MTLRWNYLLLLPPQAQALAHGENLAGLWDEVAAWRMAYDLAEDQRRTLVLYREALALAWQGEAADVFLAEMDRQIVSLNQSAEAASANERQASVAAYSLQDTQRQLDELNRQWEASVSAAPDLAAQVLAGSQRTQIVKQAQQVLMAHADTVVDAGQKLTPPIRYQVPAAWSPAGGDDGPPTGRDPGAEPLRRWVPDLPHGALATPAAAQALAVLAGGVAPTPGPVDATLPTTADLGGAPRGLGALFVDTPAGRALRHGAVIGLPPPEPPTKPTVPGQRPGSGVVDPVRGAGGSPLPGAGFGAPIGGVPRPQQPQMYKGMRVAPPGGLVGPRPAAAAGGGEVHTTANGSTFTVSNNGNAAGVTKAPTTPVGWGKKLQRKRGPDDFWSVAEGVPPVIYPPPEPYHDPGPGVFGIDR